MMKNAIRRAPTAQRLFLRVDKAAVAPAPGLGSMIPGDLRGRIADNARMPGQVRGHRFSFP